METMKESDLFAGKYNQLALDAGNKAFLINRLTGELNELYVKMHNTGIDYEKAVKAEKEAKTDQHLQEATAPKGDTNGQA